MKEVETSKGMFVVIQKTSENSYPLDIWMSHYYPLIRYKEYYKLSEITELEAKSIVGKELNEKYLLITMDWYRYKLHSLLESQGIEITNNTYIFKVC